jgi:hypothetical protein
MLIACPRLAAASSVSGSGRGVDRAVLIQHLDLDAGCGEDVGRPDPGHASRRDGLTSLDRLGIERSDQGGALQHEEQDRAGDHGEREQGRGDDGDPRAERLPAPQVGQPVHGSSRSQPPSAASR